MEGDVIKINLMKFVSNIKKEVSIQDSLINCRKHSEQRLVSLIGTVQHSSYTSKIEKDFMSDLIDEALRFSLMKISKLTTKLTHGAEGDLYTHRFSVILILEDNVTMPCDYIWRRLRRDSFEYEDNRRIFFKTA